MILHHIKPIRFFLCGLVLAATLLACGCGASEYNERLQQRGDALRYSGR